jgi:hypothetical protein
MVDKEIFERSKITSQVSGATVLPEAPDLR